jgi:hypothetical protein
MNTCNDENALVQGPSRQLVDMLFGDVMLDGLFDDATDDVEQWFMCAAAPREQHPARSAAAGNF